ncbi:MAG TPA: universal stress protein [Acidimicrobiales bacterium]|jgi:nucleotide-binding universal stress UspA family protein|nr:universal stress protein [Acidimicrobiales bacterium]
MPQKIMVGTDGSATAALAVDRAVEVAKARGVALTIVSAGPRELGKAIVDREARRHASSGVTIRTETVPGEPSAALIEAAHRGNYDLLVVGNRGLTGITRFLRLGSVPSKVMHRLPCDLLVVKTT